MPTQSILPKELHPIRCLIPLLAPYAWQVGAFVVIGVLASLLEGLGIGLMIPLLQGSGAPTGANGPVLGWLDRLTGLLPTDSRTGSITALILAAILLKIVLAYAFTGLAAWIKSRVQHDVRTRAYRQILALSQEYLDAQQGGVLLHTLTSAPLEAALGVYALLWLVLNLCSLLVFSLLLMAVAWKLTLTVVATLLVLSKFVRRVVGGVKSLGKKNLGLQTDLSQQVKETLAGIRTVRAFGQESHEAGRYAAASLASHRMELRQERLVSLAHPLSEGLAAMALMGMVFLALRTGFSLPVLATVVFMLFRLLPQIQSMNTQFAVILAKHASVVAVLDLMDRRGKPYPKAGSERFGGLAQGIRFEQVSFAYRGKADPALENVDLEIPKGRTIAFVGPSGAGKSTLIHLLCRFYEPTGGRILVDGRDLAGFDLASWRERIALVSQDVHIFSGTVRDNIAYGRLDAGEGDIVAAGRRAHAHDFIMALPQGYDTLVGDRGLLLSGGQRQRLSIARAILREPDILILDEATNALDPISEAHIQAAIEELGRNRTVLVVAHRLSTIERADRIVVLDRGRVAEEGRFEALLERGGMFASLYRSHRLGITDGPDSAAPLTGSPP